MAKKRYSNESYGRKHREARQAKKDSMDSLACEVTGDTDNLQAHHNVPRLFNGPDHPSNYTLLTEHFHQKILHYVCNVTNHKLVGERVRLSRELMKNLTDDVHVARTREQINHIDEQLIDEYVHNMLNKLAYNFRERVLQLCITSSFKTIRDQNIEGLQKDAKYAIIEEENQRLREEIEELRRQLEGDES